MHIKLTNGVPEKYSIGQLRCDNPQVSFPKSIPDSTLAEFDVYPLKPTEQPQFNPKLQRIEEDTPVQQDTEWVQAWRIINLSQEEVEQIQAEYLEQVRQQRQSAYQQEADPLFFKSQRGEATQEEWLAKVAEIKARYPELE